MTDEPRKPNAATEGEKPNPGSRSGDEHEKRPEGPHATPENTNEEATPGAGTLPDADDGDAHAG